MSSFIFLKRRKAQGAPPPANDADVDQQDDSDDNSQPAKPAGDDDDDDSSPDNDAPSKGDGDEEIDQKDFDASLTDGFITDSTAWKACVHVVKTTYAIDLDEVASAMDDWETEFAFPAAMAAEVEAVGHVMDADTFSNCVSAFAGSLRRAYGEDAPITPIEIARFAAYFSGVVVTAARYENDVDNFHNVMLMCIAHAAHETKWKSRLLNPTSAAAGYNQILPSTADWMLEMGIPGPKATVEPQSLAAQKEIRAQGGDLPPLSCGAAQQGIAGAYLWRALTKKAYSALKAGKTGCGYTIGGDDDSYAPQEWLAILKDVGHPDSYNIRVCAAAYARACGALGSPYTVTAVTGTSYLHRGAFNFAIGRRLTEEPLDLPGAWGKFNASHKA